MSHTILSGRPAPLGATADSNGTNFAVSSGGDEVTLCLFDRDGTETQLVLPDRDGEVWHGFVPGVGAGQLYGFRVKGPFDPAYMKALYQTGFELGQSSMPFGGEPPPFPSGPSPQSSHSDKTGANQ